MIILNKKNKMPKHQIVVEDAETEAENKILNKDNVILTTCPKCFNIPLIQLIFNQTFKVKINCHCGYESTMELKEYLENLKKQKTEKKTCERLLQHLSKPAVKYCIQCQKWLCEECETNHALWIKNHQTISTQIQIETKCPLHHEDYEYFCFTCKKHFCFKCKSEHSEHNFKLLIEYLNENKINKIYDEFSHLVDDYMVNYLQTKEKIIAKLKNDIKLVEDAFAYNKSLNDSIFEFLKIIFDSFVLTRSTNYYTTTNIIRNSYFQLPKFPIAQQITEDFIQRFILFLKTNFISNVQVVNMDALTLQKKIEDSTINSLCLLQNGKLASCSLDKNIKIYNLQNFKCDMMISGHTEQVSYISQMDTGELLSCSEDKTIKIWSLYDTDYQCEGTLEGHSEWVYKVIPLNQERIASCSLDKTIRIWSATPPYNCIQIFTDHTAPVYSILELKGGESLVSGTSTGESCLKFWNLFVLKLEYTLNNVFCGWINSLFQYDDKMLLVGGEYCVVFVNIKNFKIEQLVRNKDLLFVRCFIKLRDGNLLLGCENGNAAVLNTKDYKIGFCEKIHNKGIKDMVVLGGMGFVTGADKEFKIWRY